MDNETVYPVYREVLLHNFKISQISETKKARIVKTRAF